MVATGVPSIKIFFLCNQHHYESKARLAPLLLDSTPNYNYYFYSVYSTYVLIIKKSDTESYIYKYVWLSKARHCVTNLNLKLKKSAGEDFVAFCHLLFMLNLMGYPKSWFIDTTLHILKIFRLNYFSSIFQSKCQFFFCFVLNCKIFRSYFTDYSIADCLSCLNLISASWVKTWVQNKKQLKCENLSIDG